MSFYCDLRNDAEEFSAVGGASAPCLQHLLHLAASAGIDLFIGIQEKSDNKRGEDTSIRVENVLGYGIKEVESGELHPRRHLTRYQKRQEQ